MNDELIWPIIAFVTMLIGVVIGYGIRSVPQRNDNTPEQCAKVRRENDALWRSLLEMARKRGAQR